MDRIISTIDLEVGYLKNESILKNISFQVAEGEIIAIIGGNGTGKSTLLKTIIRQLKKQAGEIRICDVDEATLAEAEIAKELSMVMTERINPELMDCFEMVATGRYPYTGMFGKLSDEDIKIINSAIEMVGAQAVANKDFSKISDGQRQRIMLARAICQDTRILVLDEPTSFLDVQYKIDILKVIKKLAKEQNKAIIMSIHELEYVPAIADRVLGICDGEVYKIGTPKKILTGDNLEKMYHMKEGTGEIIASGLLEYSEALKKLLS